MNNALNGIGEKSPLHQLRANLRWTRQRMMGERDVHKKKALELDVMNIEREIKVEAEKDSGKKRKP